MLPRTESNLKEGSQSRPSMEVYLWVIYRSSVHVKTATSGLRQTRLEHVAFNWEHSCKGVLTDASEAAFIKLAYASWCLQWLSQRGKKKKKSKVKQAVDQTCCAYRWILFHIHLLRNWALQKRTRLQDTVVLISTNIHRLLTWGLVSENVFLPGGFFFFFFWLWFRHSLQFWRCSVCCDLVNKGELQ